jgi:hypothetical protein
MVLITCCCVKPKVSDKLVRAGSLLQTCSQRHKLKPRYLDPSKSKYQTGGKKKIMNSFVVCARRQMSLGWPREGE